MQRLKIHNTLQYLILITGLFFLFSCFPAIKDRPKSTEEALIPVNFWYPDLTDDLDRSSLIEASKRNLEYLKRLKKEEAFQYGPHRYSKEQVVESQIAFLDILSSLSDMKEIDKRIKRDFLIYKASGSDETGRVLFTGYYEPTFEARTERDRVFQHPIYLKPHDLIKVDLSLFDQELRGKTIIGRLNRDKLIPYFSRQEIVMDKALEGRGLEIAWLKDPADVAFLHIQGSGRLDLGNGRSISVGYAEKNGRPYRPIGRYLMEKGLLQKEEISMQSIRLCLDQHPEIKDDVLNSNPSYIFFRTLERNGSPLGSLNIPVTPGRSLALDPRVFPMGAIAFITTRKPVENERGEVKEWRDFSRFVLVQDTGGAIRGTGRADIFWGNGPYAELAAGHLKHEGDLYILIKRPS